MTRAVDAWERFWFKPEPTSTLAVVRIAFGLLCLGWAVSLAPDLSTFFSTSGIVPDPPRFGGLTAGAWSILGAEPGTPALLGLYSAFLLCSLMLIAGLWTRVAAAVVFVAVFSLQRRDPYVFNGGDQLIRILALYLMLAPSGASLSADRWLRCRGRFWEFPLRAPWVIRLMQLQLSLIYAFSVWTKLRGTTWNDGSAVYYALRIGDLERFPLPDALTNSAYVSNLLTWGTLGVEASVAVFVWNRRLRPWVLVAGATVHLFIDYSLRVGFFSYAMLTLYLAWIPPERVSNGILALRAYFGRSPRASLASEKVSVGGS